MLIQAIISFEGDLINYFACSRLIQPEAQAAKIIFEKSQKLKSPHQTEFF